MALQTSASRTGSPATTRSATQGPDRTGGTMLSALQHRIGNRATQTLLSPAGTAAPVMRQYKATSKQRTALQTLISKQWGKPIKAEGSLLSDIVDAVIAWCDSHDQALRLVGRLDYDGFVENESRPASTVDDELLGGSGATKEKEADPMARLKKEVKKAGRAMGDFSASEQQSILTLAATEVGWQAAVKSVWDTHETARLDAELKASRIAKYATSKTAGDVAFGAPALLQAIWNTSYAVAVSANASKNATTGGEHSDAAIVAAASIWHHHATVDKVTNFHVPGHPHATIEDKSRRAVNPDPSRGRQADFIADWDGGAINVHVDSDQHH